MDITFYMKIGKNHFIFLKFKYTYLASLTYKVVQRITKIFLKFENRRQVTPDPPCLQKFFFDTFYCFLFTSIFYAWKYFYTGIQRSQFDILYLPAEHSIHVLFMLYKIHKINCYTVNLYTFVLFII